VGVRQASKAREYVKVTYDIGSSQHCIDEQKKQNTQEIVLVCAPNVYLFNKIYAYYESK
jgi:hypothetical protein